MQVLYLSILLGSNSTYTACSEGAVRLVGGSNRAEGTVELCQENAWGTICDVGWDDLDANTTCSNLQFYWGKCSLNHQSAN